MYVFDEVNDRVNNENNLSSNIIHSIQQKYVH